MPRDPDTGKEYPYTKAGIAQFRRDQAKKKRRRKKRKRPAPSGGLAAIIAGKQS